MTIAAAWWWLAAGLILGAAEALVPGVFLLPIGVAAAITGLILFGWDAGFAESLLVFCAALTLAILVARRVYGREPERTAAPNLNRRAEGLIGRVVTLDTAMSAGRGLVRIDDSVWRATGPDLPAGTRVRVHGLLEGGTLLDVSGA